MVWSGDVCPSCVQQFPGLCLKVVVVFAGLLLFIMSGSGGGADQPPGSDEPPGAVLNEAPDPTADEKDVCEPNKSQLETLKEIMFRNKESLKKKEEEVQEYAQKLSKIKSRAKLSRRSRDPSSSVEGTPEMVAKSKISSPSVENFNSTIEDISQARTPKAKSSLLQKKLAENRKIFEQRSREMTENKRAVEEKVEAIRQQLDESDTTTLELQKEVSTVVPVQPVVITLPSSGLQHFNVQDKDHRIAELNNKILMLEATVLDLEENLKEKDSVIDSKAKAVTLMTADLSKKSKSTLDTLEDTKDEMRTMQSNFVLIEKSLKHKIDSLLQQLQGRDGQIAEYENTVGRLKDDLEKQKLRDICTANFSRATFDTLAETEEAMKSMQENFILIESSLKSKNTHLLDQLQEREIKLAEAEQRIFTLESSAGNIPPPDVIQLQSKLATIEQQNHQLQDEKYELQKSVAQLQDRVISQEPAVSNGLIVEKDNRIAELENLVEELRKSNQLLLEESRTELQNQIVELTFRNEEYANQVSDLEKLVHDLETEKNELSKRITENSEELKEDAQVTKLSKELDELNKSMIKLKTQHKTKVKGLQKQLESFKKISDVNAELVKLRNQVTLLEEEKASAGDWQERIVDLETKISAQSNEIDSQLQAIAILENQKLDLMQELHTVKQEVSTLEAEIAESENLRVTAEMKVVELEEQLDALHKRMVEHKQSDVNKSEKIEYLDKLELLTQENHNLIIKLTKLEEKGTSDAGSTESFETLHETDRNELMKKIDILTQENSNLIINLTKLEEKIGTTDFFGTSNDTSKSELLKKIDDLIQENNSLLVKIAKLEEKSSSDTGSTESFERIPEHVDNLTRLDILTQENNELVIKLIKLEEKLAQIEESPNYKSKAETMADDDVSVLKNRIHALTQENNDLVIQLTKLQEKGGDFLQAVNQKAQPIDILMQEKSADQTDKHDVSVVRVTNLEETNESFKIMFDVATNEKDALQGIVDYITTNNFARELVEKLNQLSQKNQIAYQLVREEISKILDKVTQQTDEMQDIGASEDSVGYQESATITLLEKEIEICKKFITEQKEIMENMELKLSEKEDQLQLQTKKISEYQAANENLEELQKELKDSLGVIQEWQRRCKQMESKINTLESEKKSIEKGLKELEAENVSLVTQSEYKNIESMSLKKELDDTISHLEIKLNEAIALVSAKEDEIMALKQVVSNKDADLHDKYEKIQNEMITIDSLQEDLNNYKQQFNYQANAILSLKEEIVILKTSCTSNEEEIASGKAEIQNLQIKLEHSKSLEEFNTLNQTLNDKQQALKEMQNKINEQADEIISMNGQIETMTLNIHNMENQLIGKANEIAQLMELNKDLHKELNHAKNVESTLTTQISHLQNTFDQNSIYVDDLRGELSGVYKKLELVKAQHIEDTALQNRRLEDLIEDLNSKLLENESLKSEIEEKHKLLGQNVTEECKIALELRVADLEEKLSESEIKGKAQLDKMKKIAANLKKKVTQCQDLEAKVSDLEEKWHSEKSEKETINEIIREKDIKISELEKRVLESENQASMALDNVKRLVQEIDVSKEKVTSLMEQVTEMGEEIEKLRLETNEKAWKLEIEKEKTQKLLTEYQVYKEQIGTRYEKQQQDLEEATERARELRVRMEVMESEYVEQLSLIQKLKAENGMLSSKETQINEKLENVEKESEERLSLLEKLQKEKSDVLEKVEAYKVLTLDCELRADVTQTSQKQCQTSVQVLEVKLQERDAVIESLEIELGKSNDRVNKLEEALVAVEERRYSLEKTTELLGAELEQSFRITEEASFSEDMLEQRLATLTAKDEAISEKLNETIVENNELTEKIQSLQDLNVSLQERIDAVTEELKCGRETNEKLQTIDLLYSELLQKHNLLEIELKKAQQELHSAQQHIDSSDREVTSQINQLDSEKRQLLEKCERLEDLRISLIQEVDSLKDGVGLCQQRISELETDIASRKEINRQLVTELENQRVQTPISKENLEDIEKLKLLIAEKDMEIENYQRRNMQLQMATFDLPKSDISNVFDMTIVSGTLSPTAEIDKLTDPVGKKEQGCTKACIELDNVKQQFAESESRCERLLIEKDHLEASLQVLQMDYNKCSDELVRTKEILSEKDQLINSLNLQLSDFSIQLEMCNKQQSSYEEEIHRLSGIITSKDEEQHEAGIFVNKIILFAEQRVNNIRLNQDEINTTNSLGLHKIASTFNDLLADLENVKLQKDELLCSQESYKNELIALRRQLTDGSTSLNDEQVQELKNQLERIVDEKTTLQKLLQIQELSLNDVKRELDEVSIEKQSLEAQLSDVRNTINQLSNYGDQVEEVGKSVSNSKELDETLEKTEWGAELSSKLDIEEEGWGWSAEEAQLEEQYQISPAVLTPSVEIQLQTRVAELEDQIKTLESKRDNLEKESKTMQLKNVKLVKKLKEFKVQNDLLQQKLQQQQLSTFSDLDTAIEEELKAQIESLEKSLKEVKQEQKKDVGAKEHLQKRLEVLTAANERFVEMKEKQDMELEILKIQNKELSHKIQSLEWQLQEMSCSNNQEEYDMTSSQIQSQSGLAQSINDQSYAQISRGNEQPDQFTKQLMEELSDLKEEMEALASENEQLQHLLAEQKSQSTFAKINVTSEVTDTKNELAEVVQRNSDLQKNLNKLKEEYSLLRKQYEQSLMDANDQVTAVRQNNDLLNMEFDNERQSFAKEVGEWKLKVDELDQKSLDDQRKILDLQQKIELLNSAEDKLSLVSTSLAEVTELLNTRVQEVADLKQNSQLQYLERMEAENKLHSKIEDLSQELSSTQQELLNLRQLLSDKEKDSILQQSVEIHRLEVELVNREQEIERLRHALADTENGLQEDVRMLQKESEQLKSVIVERDSSLKKLNFELQSLRQELSEKESYLERYIAELPKYSTKIEKNRAEVNESKCAMSNQCTMTQTEMTDDNSANIQEKEEHINELKITLDEKNSMCQWKDQELQKMSDEYNRSFEEISRLKEQIDNKNIELEKLNDILLQQEAIIKGNGLGLNETQKHTRNFDQSTSVIQTSVLQDAVPLADTLPRFRMSSNNDFQVETDVETLRSKLREQSEEIEHFKYMLSKNTYPDIIQQLQDNINQLHKDKYETEQSLKEKIQLLNNQLNSKDIEIEKLKQQVILNEHEIIPRESHGSVATKRTSLIDQEKILKLQDELHKKEQEINELRYVITERHSQISLEAISGPQFDEYTAQETIQRLKGELYGKEQEVESLKVTLAEKEKDIEELKIVENLMKEDKNLILMLSSEKESIKDEAEKALQSQLAGKEAEIDALKQYLVIENQDLLNTLQLRDVDVQNLTTQIENMSSDYNTNLHFKSEELLLCKANLAEKERALEEITIAKDAEIHKLAVQIHDKEIRIKELLALSEEEERQLNELRQIVETKEGEISNLKVLLAETVQEYEIIQKALKKGKNTGTAQLGAADTQTASTTPAHDQSEESENSSRSGVVSVEGELDLALYMLHQRDVRCEELTLELMQLLQERDTLQLRLSNAIRINEELRKQKLITPNPKKDSPLTSSEEPLVEHPSPSKTGGPVEIAKEAFDVDTSSVGEDRDVLAQKLSQLHTVHQRRDVTLCDERESRHTQQMSFVARRDMLSSLPPEAAARLVNANYTLSRDVQSQSSVLMNWLWGKSTPKVMHM
ncbi:protein lava lamp isoform X2 [Athalia rosae]|uniref:protein lava lamp isoform X2 n=1 Tax=Athalia rosae TaxID=37344 RepID=UPI0020339185|nr:protein lava lamp isoform X2 [Athalia rosae]